MAELRDALKKLTDASPDELEELLRLSQGTQRQQLLKAVVEAEASLVPQAGQLQEPAAPLPISRPAPSSSLGSPAPNEPQPKLGGLSHGHSHDHSYQFAGKTASSSGSC